jgi:hypothetical protein
VLTVPLARIHLQQAALCAPIALSAHKLQLKDFLCVKRVPLVPMPTQMPRLCVRSALRDSIPSHKLVSRSVQLCARHAIQDITVRLLVNNSAFPALQASSKIATTHLRVKHVITENTCPTKMLPLVWIARLDTILTDSKVYHAHFVHLERMPTTRELRRAPTASLDFTWEPPATQLVSSVLPVPTPTKLALSTATCVKQARTLLSLL